MKNITKWDYFMSLAFLTARRSKDPSTQCGASIISPRGRIFGLGYNGMPNGCKNTFPWEREGDFLDTKYAYVVHAEQNAIFNSEGRLDGCTMFTTLFPCNLCAQAIDQVGIKMVVYWHDKYHDKDFSVAARRIFSAADIETIDLKTVLTDITFDDMI